MSSKKKASHSTPAKETEEPCELDLEFIASLAKQIPPNPVTGLTEMKDIVKFMINRPEDTDRILQQMNTLNNKPIDFANNHVKQLAKAIKPNSLWVFQMDDMKSLEEKLERDLAATHSPRTGTRSVTILYIYDEEGSYRVTHDIPGDITADHLIDTVQRSIVKPIPPMAQALPATLILSVRFQRFAPALRPFLDSLPSPFAWRFETEEENRTVAAGRTELREKEFRIYFARSGESKQQGNEAFKKQDRKKAVDAYTMAIDEMHEALVVADLEDDVDAVSDAQSALAICYANRAAAWCIEGNGMDAKKALEDGQSSENMNKTYAKAYYRQAKAHIILKQPMKAEHVLVRALTLPELENENSLVDFLIELQTNGRGLPQDDEGLKQWTLDLMTSGSEHANVSNVQGEWKRRCDELFERFEEET